MTWKSFNLSLHVIAVSVLIAGTAGVWQSGAAEPRQLTVSAASVAGNNEKSDKAADYFTQRIGVGRDYQARKAASCSWDEVPQGCAAENQVNVLQLRFGNRIELLAVMPDPRSGAVVMAARAPALNQFPSPFTFAYMAPSGDYQVPENAPNDLVANFAYAMEHRREPKGAYQLILQPWEGAKQTGGGDATQEKSFSMKGDGLMRLYPLAAAAMYADNFQACSKERESVIILRFQMDEAECAIHASLHVGGKKMYELERHGIKYEKLYDTLQVLFLNLIEWQGVVADFLNPGGDAFQPVTVVEAETDSDAFDNKKTVLVGKDKNGFSAFEPATGNSVWKIIFNKGQSGICRNGQLFLCDASTLTNISTSNGKSTFSLMVEDKERMDVRSDLCVDAAYHRLRLFDKAAELWNKPLPWSIQAGPLLAGESIVLGDAKGEFRCFSLKGQELWTIALPKTVYGRIYTDGGLFFANDDCGGMFMIDKQGKLVSHVEVGDVLCNAPQVVGSTIVVGTKSGKLFLFDAATFKCLKTHQLKSWLLGCRVVGKKILCLTLGNLQIVDLASFELEKTLRFPFKWNPEILPVRNFPQLRIQEGGGPSEKTTGYLMSDVKGNMYLYATEKKP